MRILIPIDGSAASDATLDWAVRFLDPKRARIYLLTVIPINPEVPQSGTECQDAVILLRTKKAWLNQKGFGVEEARYVLGDPAQAICDYADEMGMDQIVMGSHGRRGLGRVLMGSVSETVFRHARQPVLVFNNRQNDRPRLNISHVDNVPLAEER